jgi:MFS family permease
MAHLNATQTRRVELEGTAALAAVASLLGVAFGLSTVVTPLYLLYQQQFGFSQITLTLIYAAYAIGNVAAVLFFGRLSDTVGRRLTALAAIAVLIVATFVFLFAAGIASLYLARILSGLGIGIASGTANAWLAELVGGGERARAATIGTGSNFLGVGIAPLASGLLAQYAPWPLQLPFVIYLVVLCTVATLIWSTHETVDSDVGNFSIRPRLSLPREIRAEFVAPAITGFGLMALVGFYTALMPSMLSLDLHIKNHAAAGGLLFELEIVVALVIVATQAVESRLALGPVGQSNTGAVIVGHRTLLAAISLAPRGARSSR